MARNRGARDAKMSSQNGMEVLEITRRAWKWLAIEGLVAQKQRHGMEILEITRNEGLVAAVFRSRRSWKSLAIEGLFAQKCCQGTEWRSWK